MMTWYGGIRRVRTSSCCSGTVLATASGNQVALTRRSPRTLSGLGVTFRIPPATPRANEKCPPFDPAGMRKVRVERPLGSRGAQHLEAAGTPQERRRRLVGEGQRLGGEEVGVLQGESTAEDGVARGVGDGEP